MRVLDLFSGIGGFALGLEACGMETVAFCEQDGFARRVLKKNFPDAWIYDDVRTLTAKRLKHDGNMPIDLICGGFPCQDISLAGKGAGIKGKRSSLWFQFARLANEIKPDWIIVENVASLRGRGADIVLGDLDRIGYTATPLVVGAVHAGAKHLRSRVWIVAHSACVGRINADSRASNRENAPGRKDHIEERQNGRLLESRGKSARRLPRYSEWSTEPELGRVVDGFPGRVDRLKCLGNSVVPQIVEIIGKSILSLA